MLSNSQKEHLTYTAIGQIFTLCAIGLITFQYILPWMTEVDKNLANANAEIDGYTKTYNNGINLTTLWNLLAGKPERLELIKIIQSDKPWTEKVIQKVWDQNYLEWLTQSIGKSDSDKQILIQEKMKLNSIIPTLSPVSANIEEENVTLKQYVKFIEGTILKKFHFDSNVVIGMQGITFWDKWTNAENIGMFEFRFDFKWTNSDISQFITFVNTSWKPDILTTNSWSYVISKDKIPGVMGNPLMSVTSFSLQNILDPNNPNGENSGRVTLKFYVRGISKDDLLFLWESLKSRQENLWKEIDDNIKQCEKDGLICASYINKLKIFKVKYNEFTRWLDSAKIIWTGTDQIYPLSQAINTIKSLEKELDGILPKVRK